MGANLNQQVDIQYCLHGLISTLPHSDRCSLIFRWQKKSPAGCERVVLELGAKRKLSQWKSDAFGSLKAICSSAFTPPKLVQWCVYKVHIACLSLTDM